jgi:hypothetical protein
MVDRRLPAMVGIVVYPKENRGASSKTFLIFLAAAIHRKSIN